VVTAGLTKVRPGDAVKPTRVAAPTVAATNSGLGAADLRPAA